MNTFMGQDNAEIKEFCSENQCELEIVPHQVTSKFKLFDITINQKAKKFISHNFSTWYGDQVSNQLKRDVVSGNVKVSLKALEYKLNNWNAWLPEATERLDLKLVW